MPGDNWPWWRTAILVVLCGAAIAYTAVLWVTL